jgi:hypothetical protein
VALTDCREAGGKEEHKGVVRRDTKQLPRSPRRNVLSAERINRPFLLHHKHPACSLVELLEVTQIAPRSDRVLITRQKPSMGLS